MYLGVFFKI